MNFLLWIIIGGVIGWLASIIVGTDREQGIFLNIIVGIVGAFVGGILFSPLVGGGTINTGSLSLTSLLISLLGAIVFLALVSFLRGAAR